MGSTTETSLRDIPSRLAGWALFTLLATAGICVAGAEVSERRNGFSLSPASVAVAEIIPGGPERDGIPALYHPTALLANEAAWGDDERVVGVFWRGEARAYPLSILLWHELVNDTLGGRPILVSYCPLCGTALVFDRSSPEGERHFGVSGLLYRSDVLMYDRETESLWSQISFEAVAGPALGKRLAPIRSKLVRFSEWRLVHPDTSVLSRETGYSRDYGGSPYGDYETSSELFFPVKRDRRYHPKTPTVGLRFVGGTARAYPLDEVKRAGGEVKESFLGYEVRVGYDDATRSFDVRAPAELEVVEGYWFAWLAFHPDTQVYVAPQQDPG